MVLYSTLCPYFWPQIVLFFKFLYLLESNLYITEMLMKKNFSIIMKNTEYTIFLLGIFIAMKMQKEKSVISEITRV